MIEWNNSSKSKDYFIFGKFSYASINSLSKALFNLPFRLNIYNFSNIININRIAIHAHVYYEDLILEIINKTNNIEVKFDLYITTTSLEKYNIIKKNEKKFSNSYKYYIKIVDNRGRDILPLLIQLKNNIKKYKYICHIHSKKILFLIMGKNGENIFMKIYLEIMISFLKF